MARARIAAAGLGFLLLSAATMAGAAAQSASDAAAGKPLPLLQFVRHKSKTKLAPHHRLAAVAKKKKPLRPRIAKRARIAKRTTIARHAVAKTRAAIAKVRRLPVPVASARLPVNTWAAASAALPGEMPTLTPDQPSRPVVTEPVIDTDPNQIVTGGHSVQAALPNGLNRTDPAADQAKKTAATTALPSAAATPPVRAMMVKAGPPGVQQPSRVGSASWIAQMLAALGGALAAGAVAWFLIRPAPERTYG